MADKPITVNQTSRVNLGITFLLALVTSVSIGYAAWTSTKEQVTRNTADIVQLKHSVNEQRDILIRIDENVKQLKLTQ